SFYYLLTLVFIDDRYHLHLHSFPTRRSSDLGEEAALAKIIASINKVFGKIPKVKTKIALETTAGQGSCVGHRFEHLAHIIDNVREPERICICLDTAHLFAAGTDIGTESCIRTT